LDAGQLRFGENRIQEAEPKIQTLRGISGLEWHLVGHLQSNKARRAAELFNVVHSLDSTRLAVRLSEACSAAGKVLRVLLQVDLGHEKTKYGADPAEVRNIVATASDLEGIRLDGLMTIPPFFEDPEKTRPYFSALRQLRDTLRSERTGCLGGGHLSMGMSHDFEVAIQEGATMVRVGTAIFGDRTYV
jgi:pyridoxal phosphate enzyme (YggS family)